MDAFSRIFVTNIHNLADFAFPGLSRSRHDEVAFDLLHKDVDQIRFFKKELTSYYDEHAKSERLKNFLVVLRDLEESNYSSLPHSSSFRRVLSIDALQKLIVSFV